MIDEILKIRPYFFSFREIILNKISVFSLDIKIPVTWEYKLITEKYSAIEIKEQDKSGELMLLSLITRSINEKGMTDLLNSSQEIITYNKEEEEKQRLFKIRMNELKDLFKEKTDELKNMFKSSTLNDLKNVNVLKNEEEHRFPDTETIEEVGEGKEPGTTRDKTEQTQLD